MHIKPLKIRAKQCRKALVSHSHILGNRLYTHVSRTAVQRLCGSHACISGFSLLVLFIAGFSEWFDRLGSFAGYRMQPGFDAKVKGKEASKQEAPIEIPCHDIAGPVRSQVNA